jgi:hypothetical protein
MSDRRWPRTAAVNIVFDRTSKRNPVPYFHVGAFDEAARLQPTRHIFPEERLSWLHLGDA